ncbi:MAG TPA: TetR/AcrR family transcriptional regulator [Bacillota bacterium]|jgi:AcrR family transcriptional regulator|nr:TetR/AcrR family transcriptional regulator [Bacillota bacterium]
MSLSRRERERLVRESEIIAAAEKLFIVKGFDNTTMDEIAKAAEFTKRTVYQYFVSKENLFYAVIINGLKQLFSYIDDAIASGKTGFEKIQGIRTALNRFIKESPDIYRLMNYTQFIKSAHETIPNHQELMKLNSRLFSQFYQVFDAGIADGSIRPDFKMPLGVFSLFFMITGFMGRISEAGSIYAGRFDINTDELVQYTFDMMDDFIKASH